VILKLPLEREWDITIKRYVKPRTLKQNSRLHLIFSLVADETGQTIDDVKLGYKALFLKPKVVNMGNRPVVVYPSTTKMNREEINLFMTRCEQHAIEWFGIVLGDI
jgi:hypothetical protein